MRPSLTVLVAAVVGAIVGAAVASLRLPTATISETEAAPQIPDPRGELDVLSDRVQHLEEAAALAPPLERTRSEPFAPKAIDALSKRVEQLEQLLESADRAGSRTLPRGDLSVAELNQLVSDGRAPEVRRSEEEIRAQSERVILDAGAADEDKHAAHRELRRMTEAYTPVMIDALGQLGQGAADAEIRASTWTQFDGRDHLPELVPHLSFAASNDPAFQVRREAAETLGNYTDDLAVVQLLRDLAANDPHKEVRDRAKRTLNE